LNNKLQFKLYTIHREVHKRRYLLQPMALEVFSGDGRNYLLAFPRKVRNGIISSTSIRRNLAHAIHELPERTIS